MHEPHKDVDEATGTDPFDGVLVDWRGTALRMRRSAIIIGTSSLLAWLVVGLVSGGLRLEHAGVYAFLALAAMVVVEFVVVGGSALRGMLRAGERGERLAAGDVRLLPPRLRRKS